MKWTASVSELPMQKFAGIVNTVILILTFALAVFFGIFRVPFLVYFSIPTALVYIICYYLIHRDLLDAYIQLVYFWLTLYMCVTTICLGFEYGFHLYCFSMIPVIFVADYLAYALKRARLKPVMISIIIAVMYLFCTGYVTYFGPVYERDSGAALCFWVFNAVIVFTFLTFYANYLIASIIRSEEKLRELALVDNLTGLYNRHAMTERLQGLGESEPGFLALVDVDDFKMVNDLYGHNAGDEVLRTIAAKMKIFGQQCLAARWGGEEFLIHFREDIKRGMELLEQFRASIESETVISDGQEIRFTVTIGAAERKAGQSVDRWIHDVDMKLYEGKKDGKNRIAAELT